MVFYFSAHVSIVKSFLTYIPEEKNLPEDRHLTWFNAAESIPHILQLKIHCRIHVISGIVSGW